MDATINPNYLLELARQAPSLVVLGVIVYYFLRAQREMINDFRDIEAKRNETLVNISDGCHAFQRDVHEEYKSTLGKVTNALDKNSEAFGKNNYILDRAMEYFGGENR